MLDGVHQSLCAGIALEGERLQNRAHPILNPDRFRLQDFVIAIFVQFAHQRSLEFGDRIFLEQTSGFLLGQQGSDAGHLLGIAERSFFRDAANGGQGPDQPSLETTEQGL